MKAPVITISREFASMGRTIGQRLAQKLGFEILDRDIVAESARRMNMTIPEISRLDEHPGYNRFFMRKTYLFNFGVYNSSEKLYEVQRNVIEDYAEKGNCIIVGRCAESILRKRENVLRVYIYASFDDRLRHCMEDLQIGGREESEASIRRVDEARSTYRRRHQFYDNPYDNFDLLVNSGTFGIDGSVDLIESVARKKLEGLN